MPIKLYLPETRYAVASIPLDLYSEALSRIGDPGEFVSLTRDKEEVTLIISEPEWEGMKAAFPGVAAQTGRRLIRFDTVLDFSVVGFIAEVSRSLADADISILSISTYKTDAVLVHESRFHDAVNAVKRALVTLKYTHLAQH